MRQKALLKRAKWRAYGQGWVNMDEAFKVETGSRNKKILKYKMQSFVLLKPRFPKHPGAPNENIVQNHLNIALLNVF